ncbi:energy-coupling factor ABC transporter permease [Labilibaculum sp. DW002]|uniref:Cobalt transport protein CbiM n=1 Tax=Paralabilibaculum antarcticum TaxID=2912572 RepID=A0ABT5VWD8_9BACT|nr:MULTISPECIES: energy-coupling factor ABC transporter permease [unclassified Labilibaculum]MDE5419734.1 energy-coupling factor ABC transporter permease [Labilibaculum sp. DW002]
MGKKLFVLLAFLVPFQGFSMHIMEGYLPAAWSIFWTVVYLPFFVWGVKVIQKKVKKHPELKMLFALAAAFAFVLSALKLPSVTGSSSHPTGVGLGTLLFGPIAMSVLGVLVLIFQVLLLAHGGITTLGANAFSMALAGPLVTFGIYKLCAKLKCNRSVSIFLAASLGDLATYTVTAIQLALAHPDTHTGFAGAFVKFASIFSLTQIPIAIVEGLVTVLVMNILIKTIPNWDGLKFNFQTSKS